MEDEVEKKVEEMEEVRKMLITCVEKPLEQLIFIDLIQRLGLAYHFDIEIKEALDRVYMNYNNRITSESNEDIHTVSLRFRLLRQQRYSISCGKLLSLIYPRFLFIFIFNLNSLYYPPSFKELLFYFIENL